jgi:hypothetical protein
LAEVLGAGMQAVETGGLIAASLGLGIPSSVLLRTDRIIE